MPRRAAFVLALLAAGCGGGRPPDRAPPIAGASSSTAGPRAQPSAPPAPAVAKCTPEPRIDAAPDGHAFLMVNGVGVLRIDAVTGDVAEVLPFPNNPMGGDSWIGDMAVSPKGSLWISDATSRGPVKLVDTAVEVLPLGTAPSDAFFKHLAVISETQLLAAWDNIEWHILRYDGTKVADLADRHLFPGLGYDDNKLDAVVATDEGLWVASWNGLWLHAAGKWREVGPPADNGRGPWGLFESSGRLVAEYASGHYTRDGEGWKPVAWNTPELLVWAVNDGGLAAGALPDAGHIVTEPMFPSASAGAGCKIQSEPIDASSINFIALDERDRAWVSTDLALTVIDRGGAILARWTTGSLPGFTGTVLQIAVAAGGPAKLPAAQPVRTRHVTGRVKLYESGDPLGGALVRLCTGWSDCDGASALRTTKTAADGSFRLKDVPDGDFVIRVAPPPLTAGCDGIFQTVPHSLSPARNCQSQATECDLGVLTECPPFELPG